MLPYDKRCWWCQYKCCYKERRKVIKCALVKYDIIRVWMKSGQGVSSAEIKEEATKLSIVIPPPLSCCLVVARSEQAKWICDANQSKGLYRLSTGGERRGRRTGSGSRRWHRLWHHRGQIGLSCQHGHREEYPAGKFRVHFTSTRFFFSEAKSFCLISDVGTKEAKKVKLFLIPNPNFQLGNNLWHLAGVLIELGDVGTWCQGRRVLLLSHAYHSCHYFIIVGIFNRI